MSNFAVYTKIGCPYCTKVIAALGLAEQQFVEYKLGRDFNKGEFYLWRLPGKRVHNRRAR